MGTYVEQCHTVLVTVIDRGGGEEVCDVEWGFGCGSGIDLELKLDQFDTTSNCLIFCFHWMIIFIACEQYTETVV